MLKGTYWRSGATVIAEFVISPQMSARVQRSSGPRCDWLLHVGSRSRANSEHRRNSGAPRSQGATYTYRFPVGISWYQVFSRESVEISRTSATRSTRPSLISRSKSRCRSTWFYWSGIVPLRSRFVRVRYRSSSGLTTAISSLWEYEYDPSSFRVPRALGFERGLPRQTAICIRR